MLDSYLLEGNDTKVNRCFEKNIFDQYQLKMVLSLCLMEVSYK